MADENADTWKEFHDTVNMTAGELEKWLGADESRKVGQKSGGGESTGHASGRKVVGYAHRHLAQRPSGDITESDWRYSLMNWGHGPCKSS